MAGPSQQIEAVGAVSPKERLHEVVETYAAVGSFTGTAAKLGLHPQQVLRIIKSPQGSFALEQLLRDRARTRALKLANLTDRTIDEFEVALTNGNERVLNSRRDGEPLTVFLRPDIKDLTGALAWMTHHLREVQESLSVVDVSNHDVSHEARSQNLASLRELVSQEERRLQLDNERSADAPAVDAPADTPWSRSRWGGLESTPKRLSSPRGGDSAEHGLGSSAADASSSSAADAVAPLTHNPSSSAPDTEAPSRNRPPTPAPARETGIETSADIRSSPVDWDDLKED